MDVTTLAGEYYLQGMQEMASSFLLKADGDFQFFFTYGALDRQGSGKWAVKNNQVVFNSGPQPEHDFALVETNINKEDAVIIRIKDNNPSLSRYVFASLANGKEGSWQPMNKEGYTQFPKQEIDTVSLLFEFCPERFSTFHIKDKGHNDLSFRFEPWIVEIFFKQFALQIDADGLSGKHPLLEGDTYHYAKQ